MCERFISTVGQKLLILVVSGAAAVAVLGHETKLFSSISRSEYVQRSFGDLLC